LRRTARSKEDISKRMHAVDDIRYHVPDATGEILRVMRADDMYVCMYAYIREARAVRKAPHWKGNSPTM